jgi:hypothetical protein
MLKARGYIWSRRLPRRLAILSRMPDGRRHGLLSVWIFAQVRKRSSRSILRRRLDG